MPVFLQTFYWLVGLNETAVVKNILIIVNLSERVRRNPLDALPKTHGGPDRGKKMAKIGRAVMTVCAMPWRQEPALEPAAGTCRWNLALRRINQSMLG